MTPDVRGAGRSRWNAPRAGSLSGRRATPAGSSRPRRSWSAARYLNCTVEPGTRPATVVLACSVGGAVIHVLPPSVLYCHSYDARRSADGGDDVRHAGDGPRLRGEGARVARGRLADGDAGALDDGRRVRRVRVGGRLDVAPELLEEATSAVRFSSRAAAAPLVRASAAVSAARRSSMAAVTAASVGVGAGKEGLPVIRFTMPSRVHDEGRHLLRQAEGDRRAMGGLGRGGHRDSPFLFGSGRWKRKALWSLIETASSFGKASCLLGRAFRPMGAASCPAGRASWPMGAASRPVGRAPRPFGEASRPAAGASRPIVRESCLVGQPSRPTGGRSCPVGRASRSTGETSCRIGGTSPPMREPPCLVRGTSRSTGEASCLVSRAPRSRGGTAFGQVNAAPPRVRETLRRAGASFAGHHRAFEGDPRFSHLLNRDRRDFL